MTALPPLPEVTVIIPRPLVGDEATEYVALNAAAETRSFDVLMSSVLVILPVGVAPLAANSPEKTTTPKPTGLVAYPAYVPLEVPIGERHCGLGSPYPNKTLASETKRKISFGVHQVGDQAVSSGEFAAEGATPTGNITGTEDISTSNGTVSGAAFKATYSVASSPTNWPGE